VYHSGGSRAARAARLGCLHDFGNLVCRQHIFETLLYVALLSSLSLLLGP
jgi:hypothetical protein